MGPLVPPGACAPIKEALREELRSACPHAGLLPLTSQERVKFDHFLDVPLSRTQPSLTSSQQIPLHERPCPDTAALLPGWVMLWGMADFLLVSQKIQDNGEIRVIAISRCRGRPV